MTEHAAVIFVFFFLAEYASIVLICTLSPGYYTSGRFARNALSSEFASGCSGCRKAICRLPLSSGRS